MTDHRQGPDEDAEGHMIHLDVGDDDTEGHGARPGGDDERRMIRSDDDDTEGHGARPGDDDTEGHMREL
jgi:hypothetical protein